MRKAKIGVVGAGRGMSFANYCLRAENAALAAVCDSDPGMLTKLHARFDNTDTAVVSDFNALLAQDLDAVVLANYANEHAPLAMRVLRAGKHVLSEVLPAQNLAECVALIEAVEETGMTYAYAENYCYMPGPREMRSLMRAWKLGTFEYAEGEYMHNCESIWPDITQGRRDHWRNAMSAAFYCTHSLGPLIHISGLHPVRVSGFELPHNARMARMGARAGFAAVEMVTLENGAVVKSLHGVGPSRNSVWYSVYGSKGAIETAREGASPDGVGRVHVSLDAREGENATAYETYCPTDALAAEAQGSGHGNSDYYTTYNFVERIMGREADTIDVYEAMDMFLPGLFAYRSILAGGAPMDVPDLRDRTARDIWQHDTACTDPRSVGDMIQPSYSKGNPDIPDAIYDEIRARWQK
jgi:predicted dehydrogenase